MKNGIRSIRFSLVIFCYYVGFLCHRPKFIALIEAASPIFHQDKVEQNISDKLARNISLYFTATSGRYQLILQEYGQEKVKKYKP